MQSRSISWTRPTRSRLLAEHLLPDPARSERALVFTRTKHGADRVVRELSRDGHPGPGHSRRQESQDARQERARPSFKQGKIHVLIATDIAARGIDIAGTVSRV